MDLIYENIDDILDTPIAILEDVQYNNLQSEQSKLNKYVKTGQIKWQNFVKSKVDKRSLVLQSIYNTCMSKNMYDIWVEILDKLHYTYDNSSIWNIIKQTFNNTTDNKNGKESGMAIDLEKLEECHTSLDLFNPSPSDIERFVKYYNIVDKFGKDHVNAKDHILTHISDDSMRYEHYLYMMQFSTDDLKKLSDTVTSEMFGTIDLLTDSFIHKVEFYGDERGMLNMVKEAADNDKTFYWQILPMYTTDNNALTAERLDLMLQNVYVICFREPMFAGESENYYPTVFIVQRKRFQNNQVRLLCDFEKALKESMYSMDEFDMELFVMHKQKLELAGYYIDAVNYDDIGKILHEKY
jgi:hypothetical protein